LPDKKLGYKGQASYLTHRLNEALLDQEIREHEASPVPDENIIREKKEKLERSRKIREGIYNGDIIVGDDLQDIAHDDKTAADLNVAHIDQVSEDELPGRPSPEEGIQRVDHSHEAATVDAIQDWHRQNRNWTDELFEGYAATIGQFNDAVASGAERYQAHGMAKASPTEAIRNLISIFRGGLKENKTLYTAPLVLGEENRGAASAMGTASGEAYKDGPFTLVAREKNSDIKSVDDIGAILVNEQLGDKIVEHMKSLFPGVVVDKYSNVKNVIDQLNQNSTNNAEGKKQQAQTKGQENVLTPESAKTEVTPEGQAPAGPAPSSSHKLTAAAAIYDAKQKIEQEGGEIATGVVDGKTITEKVDHDHLELAVDGLEHKLNKNGKLTKKDLVDSILGKTAAIKHLK
jgi:hypothetical protein